MTAVLIIAILAGVAAWSIWLDESGRRWRR